MVNVADGSDVDAVRVVLPWSTWPMVPMLMCGFVLSNFCLAILGSSYYNVIFWKSDTGVPASHAVIIARIIILPHFVKKANSF